MACRQQRASLIFRGQQDDIKVTVQAAMLKAVVQEVKLAGKLLFGQKACLIPVSPNDHWRLQLARNQKRFIAKLGRRAVRIDNCDLSRRATVTSGESIERDSPFLQHRAQ